jgi:hypothetical protein
MTNAKQTAMRKYNLTTWPASHVRSKADCDCRGYACVLMLNAGYSKRETAKQLGFGGGCPSVTGAIKRYELRRNRDNLDTLLSYFNQLQPIGG